MGTLEEAYDGVEALGLDPFPEGSAGESSTGYASSQGTLSMVTEMPQWKHLLADDTAPSGKDYAAALREQAAALSASGELLLGLLRRLDAWLHAGLEAGSAAHSDPEPPLLRASRAFLPLLSQAGQSQRARSADPACQREGTVAEIHGLQGILHMLRLRFGGMFLRALREVGAVSLAEELSPVYTGWLAEAAGQEQDLEAIPIKDAAGLQYGAVLALAAHPLRTRRHSRVS